MSKHEVMTRKDLFHITLGKWFYLGHHAREHFLSLHLWGISISFDYRPWSSTITSISSLGFGIHYAARYLEFKPGTGVMHDLRFDLLLARIRICLSIGGPKR